jgi:very-short-patch-repair endonuclease
MPTDLSQFTGQGIGMSLFGLESMNVGEPWRLLLESLIKRLKVIAMSIGGSKPSSKDFISIQTAYQHLSLVLDNDKSALMNGFAELGLAGELHSLQSLLGQKLDDLEQVLKEDSRSSNTEQQYIEKALKVLDSSVQESGSWRVVSRVRNKLLHGFDTDLVVVLGVRQGTVAGNKYMEEKKMVLNIEIDGPHHQRKAQKQFDNRRNTYLSRNHDIKVIRVDVMKTSISSAPEYLRKMYDIHLKHSSKDEQLETQRVLVSTQTMDNGGEGEGGKTKRQDEQKFEQELPLRVKMHELDLTTQHPHSEKRVDMPLTKKQLIDLAEKLLLSAKYKRDVNKSFKYENRDVMVAYLLKNIQ